MSTNREPVWWREPCSGPYTTPCFELWDDHIAAQNLRLYQWCPRCLFELSVKFGHHEDAGSRDRPALTKRPG
jgi:hypothetical protein